MDERQVIDRYFTRRAAGRRDVLVGIGDDAAVTMPGAGRALVVAVDSVFEGTHFPPGTPAAAVGHRVLAVNLSDLAAMGASPLWFTLALSLPRIQKSWLDEFARGLFDLADRFGIGLIGGDTVRGPLSATVTVVGDVAPGGFVTRGGARPGDGVWVTGTPGDAVAGRQLPPADGTLPADAARLLVDRFLYPAPRVQEGIGLAALASAMIDVSDGVHDDIGKLLAASGVGAELAIEALPLSPALRMGRPDDAVDCALTGGDDYELCFTVPSANEQALAGLVSGWAIPVTRLGTVVAGPGVRWTLDGREFNVPAVTFEHFPE